MKVVVTGGEGFLGWHTRVRLKSLGVTDVVSISRSNWASLPDALVGADAVLHLAGVNRAEPDEVERGNVDLAADLARALDGAGSRPAVVYANSIHAGSDTPYGRGKARAAEILADVAGRTGCRVVDVRLPNLFGEGGRPDYNSFVQTFVQRVLDGIEPEIVDRPIELLHAQRAAQVLIDAVGGNSTVVTPHGALTSVGLVRDKLVAFDRLYRSGDLPPLLDDLDLDLFNTLRWAAFPQNQPIVFESRRDHRGALVEVVRSHGGQGQTFVSTTRPGVTRGEHFHLHKVERFAVLSGRARISLRRVLGSEVISFDVDGDQPCAIDMPTMWAHNITNVSDTELTTLFWTHELFDPGRPDTYAEPVGSEPALIGGAV